MSERITRETFDHLVKLAELELDQVEAEYLRQELNNQLDAIHQLEAIPLEEDVPISLHGVSYQQVDSQGLREDCWRPFENVQGILSQVPELIDEQITVPETPHRILD